MWTSKGRVAANAAESNDLKKGRKVVWLVDDRDGGNPIHGVGDIARSTVQSSKF
jgi:hypothetical protein